MENKAEHWIQQLGLERHVEGGYFKEIYQAAELIPASGLPKRYGGVRMMWTAIYYLLTSDEVSVFHTIKSDELWHFYYGAPITLHLISPEGVYTKRQIGNIQAPDCQFLLAIPAGHLMAAEIECPGSYGLCGCTVAPGFDYADYEISKRTELLALYPALKSVIEKFTK